ncbi:aspartate aminotransferase family protein [Sphingomonas sp. BK580]|uniref:aspartate aminotransferase family protein n=1 Tax=Sphingomonas sp. BK580 TaxID=2586972 RepID=UPI00162198E7|nr:aspartate aminotransferase family protein [Sphingomonas sp. BK580]MBB3694649.1 adenosylmethionine-8-amino-7-oxononanoate aminotransferase [Sphingomonas sp. BK580]
MNTQLLHRSIRRAPPLAVAGEGIYLVQEDGRRIIDASGGAAVACLGHGNARVANAIASQAQRMSYAHTSFFSSEPAEELAALLTEGKPGGLSHAFFISSGSEAMEAAIKLARQYQLERGEVGRDRFIYRRQSYHGNTLGALAISGHPARRAPYEALLDPRHIAVSPCFPYREQAEAESDEAYVQRLVAELDQAFEEAGAGKIIAFVAETVVGATTGCVAPLPGYFEGVREVCDRHGALLILDEIMSGMGRTGTTHAWQQEGVAPDIQTIAKGLGGGYQPIGGLLVQEHIVDTLASRSGIFVHGQTYQAHPVACAAALEVQRIIQEDDLLTNVRRAGARLRKELVARIGGHPLVGDVRGRGLFMGVEFVADRATRQPFEPAANFANVIKEATFDEGLAIYPGSGTIDGIRGDHLLIAPPYWVDDAMLVEIVSRLKVALDRAAEIVRAGS